MSTSPISNNLGPARPAEPALPATPTPPPSLFQQIAARVESAVNPTASSSQLPDASNPAPLAPATAAAPAEAPSDWKPTQFTMAQNTATLSESWLTDPTGSQNPLGYTPSPSELVYLHESLLDDQENPPPQSLTQAKQHEVIRPKAVKAAAPAAPPPAGSIETRDERGLLQTIKTTATYASVLFTFFASGALTFYFNNREEIHNRRGCPDSLAFVGLCTPPEEDSWWPF